MIEKKVRSILRHQWSVSETEKCGALIAALRKDEEVMVVLAPDPTGPLPAAFTAGALDNDITEIIRPAAIVPEESARSILVELALRDATNGGLWSADPARWARYDMP